MSYADCVLLIPVAYFFGLMLLGIYMARTQGKGKGPSGP